MLTRKEIEADKSFGIAARSAGIVRLADDALAKNDAILEIYHLLGGEGEPEDVVEACKKLAKDSRASVEDEIRKEREASMQTLEELRVEACTKGDWLQGSYYDRARERIRSRGGEK